MNHPSRPVAAAAPLRWSAPLQIGIVALVLVGIALSVWSVRAPAPVPASAPPDAFSAERARAAITPLVAEPRTIGSPAHASARDALVATLQQLGLETDIQTTTATNQRRGRFPLSAGSVQNVIARLPGTGTGKSVLLVGHYDTAAGSPGASDNGAAMGAMLETARALQAGPALANDVILLFSDGEESGLLGASAFLAEHPLAPTVGVALNFEARGSGGASLLFETTPNNGWLIREFASAAPSPVASSLFYEVYTYLPNDTDFTMFKEAELPGFNFAFIDDFVHYHSPLDNLANLDDASLQHHGSYALALARHFGNLDLNAPVAAGDAVYFNVGPLLAHYPAVVALFVAVLAAILWLAALVIGVRARHLTIGGVLAGVLALVLGLVIGAAVGLGVSEGVWTFHPELRIIPQGEIGNNRLFLISAVALAFAAVGGILNLFMRRMRPLNLAMGALLWWVVLSVATAVLLPGASYAFGWPALLGAIGVFWAISRPGSGSSFGAAALPALAVALLLSPIILLLSIALTVQMSPLVGGLVALATAFVWPLVGNGMVRRWVVPVGIALIGAVAFGIATTNISYNAENPLYNSILYARNADDNTARWANAGPATDPWTQQFFPDGGEDTLLTDTFPTLAFPFLAAPAPATELAAPVAEVLDDQQTANGRQVRLRVRSERGASVVAIYTDEDTRVTNALLNGKPLANTTPVGADDRWSMNYVGLPAEGIELTLELAAGSPLGLRLIDKTPGLPAPLEGSISARPADYAPSPAFSLYGFSNATYVSKAYRFP